MECYACEIAGYPKRFFSPHSIRAGVVCDMLIKAITSDTHLFASVFEQAKILGNWVTRSKAFSRYIKQSMLGTLIASRFVMPDKSEILIDSIFDSIVDSIQLGTVIPSRLKGIPSSTLKTGDWQYIS